MGKVIHKETINFLESPFDVCVFEEESSSGETFHSAETTINSEDKIIIDAPSFEEVLRLFRSIFPLAMKSRKIKNGKENKNNRGDGHEAKVVDNDGLYGGR